MSRNSKESKQRKGQWQENNGKLKLLSQFSWGKTIDNKLKKRRSVTTNWNQFVSSIMKWKVKVLLKYRVRSLGLPESTEN